MLGLAIDPLAILAEFTPPLAIDQLGLNVLILALSAMLQATAGFGAALLGLPLLLWAGNSLVDAQVILLGAMLPQNLYACWRLRRSIDYREVAVPALIRLLALPLGVAGLVLLMNLPKQMIGQFVGGVILLAIGLQSFAGRRWESGRRWPWMLLTFGGSGVLQGLTGTGGPPMVLWVYGQRFTIDRARAFLFAIYVIGFFPQIGLLAWNFGSAIAAPGLTALASIPAVLLSAAAGLRLGSLLGDRWLRPLTYLSLVVIAVVSIVEPWLTS